MPEQIENGHAENPEVHHEHSDVNVRGILWFVVAFIGLAVVVHVGLGVFYWWLEKKNYESQPAPVTLVKGGKSPMAGPRLQPFPQDLPPFPGTTEKTVISQTPAVEMKDFRERERKRLESYGWVDRTKGIVHIPIGRAMEIALSGSAFPVRQPAAPAAPGQQQPLTVATPAASAPAEARTP